MVNLNPGMKVWWNVGARGNEIGYKTNKKIADECKLDINTVGKYVNNDVEKTDMSTIIKLLIGLKLINDPHGLCKLMVVLPDDEFNTRKQFTDEAKEERKRKKASKKKTSK